jgi:hypothetical protein
MLTQPYIHDNIELPPTLKYSMRFFVHIFLCKFSKHFSHLQCVLYAQAISFPFSFWSYWYTAYVTNYKVSNCLHIFPFFCQIPSLRTTYFPKHPVVHYSVDNYPAIQDTIIIKRRGDLKEGFWIGWLDLLTRYTFTTRDYGPYSANAILNTFQFTATNSLAVSWQRTYHGLTVASTHIWSLVTA